MRRGKLVGAVSVVIGLSLIAGCSSTQDKVKHNLEERAAVARAEYSSYMTRVKTADEAATGIENHGLYAGIIDISDWKDEDYDSAALKYPTTAAWSSAAHGQEVTTRFVISTYASNGGFDTTEAMGYACISLTASVLKPSDVAQTNISCSEEITGLAFPASSGFILYEI
jgi:hypothetical protein